MSRPASQQATHDETHTADQCPDPTTRFPALRAVAAEIEADPRYTEAVAHVERCLRCQHDVENMRAAGIHYLESSLRDKPLDEA